MPRTDLSGALARLSAAGALAFLSLTTAAQVSPSSASPLAAPANGPRRVDVGAAPLAITGATLHPSPGQTVDSGSLVIQGGRITSAAPGAPAAASSDTTGTSRRDYTGMHIYAGFLEPCLEVEVPRPDPNAPGSHWNSRITPQRHALDKGAHGVDAKTGQTLREMGFVAAAISPKGGILRGTSAVVSLAPPSPDASEAPAHVYLDRPYLAASFELTSRPDAEDGPPDTTRWPRYPDSQMGAIALLRQTLSDADWQGTARSAGSFKDAENALDSLATTGPGAAGHAAPPLLFDAQDELEILRAVAICDEFKRPVAFLGSGTEYKRLDAIAKAGRAIVIPLNFPPKPKVGTLGEADSVGLRELMSWEEAPTNPRRLDAAGLTVALTTGKIHEKQGGRASFKERLGTAIKHGLAPDKALAMLTTNAAKVLGVEKDFGTLAPGKVASFVVADGPLFTDTPDALGKDEPGYVRPGKVVEVWIDGVRYPVNPRTRRDLAGVWDVTLNPPPPGDPKLTLSIDEANAVTLKKVTKDADGKDKTATIKATNIQFDDESVGGRFRYAFEHEPFGEKGVFVSQGIVERDVDGSLVMHADAQRTGGQRFEWIARRTGPLVVEPKKADLTGTWTLVLPDGPARPADAAHPRIVIADKKVSFKKGEVDLPTETVKYEDDLAVATFKSSDGPNGTPTTMYLRAVKDNPARLSAAFGENTPEKFQFARHRDTSEADEIAQVPEKLGLPFGPFSVAAPATPETLAITGGTVWTCADKNPEIIEDGVVIIRNGKVQAVGKSGAVAVPAGAKVVDARGKHIAPGIIDCHSHTGISKGVNESGQAVTAEVRIGDVTNPDDVSWYRQLGGGVTTTSNLHGSANAIGGQNQVNKNRWGVAHPADMHFEGAIPGIKFALGENVKQSNWGDRFTTRYPQTRMGVETLIRDRFTAAKEYLALVKEGKARRDLELEALGEILEGKRLIHCHSYRQDEILMLCRVARDFGFKLGTFQHGLECYKVADDVRENAIGASLFSDWWAYKVEVMDAIPYAGPILFSRGVPVSYNSDSDEMARRMNVEAGKALKYATQSGIKMTASDALKFVTLNPAKQLRIDSRVGSIEAGKDADLVVWSGVPISSMSRAEMTFVDGRPLFSLETDAAARAADQRERQRIIQKLLASEKRQGGGGDGPGKQVASAETYDDADNTAVPVVDARADERPLRRTILGDALRAAREARASYFLELLRRGIDPQYHRAGECGCDAWSSN